MNDNRKFLYVVVFERTSIQEPYVPIVREAAHSFGPDSHMLDPDIVEAILPLWFCLHLPVSPLDFLDLNLVSLKQQERFNNGHEICLLPADKAAIFLPGISEERYIPAIVIVPNGKGEAFRSAEYCGKCVLGVKEYKELMPPLLPNLWKSLWALAVNADATMRGPIPFIDSFEVGAVRLPFEHLRRQLAGPELSSLDLDALKYQASRHQTFLTVLADLERRNVTRLEAEEKLPSLMKLWATANVQNVIVCQSGTAPTANRKQRSKDRPNWHIVKPLPAYSTYRAPQGDYVTERLVLSAMTAYEGIAQKGVSIELPGVPPEMWQSLGQLESHFRNAGRPKAKYVQRALSALSRSAAELMADGDLVAIMKAQRITALSSFPIGLLTLPGDSSPLCCRIPIAQRPILPLTRALQMTLSGPDVRVLNSQFNVLIAECLQKDDPIRKYSDSGWRFLAEELEREGILVHHRDIQSVQALRREIQDIKPAVMIISGHGASDPSATSAGLWIGDKAVTYLDLEDCPPLVILSACNTTPRGQGVVNIGDLFFRDGAVAVLSTLVPVNVIKNANLMIRFFIYMLEAQSDYSKLNSLSEIWHHTQASHAVIDILSSAKTLQKWGASSKNGVSVLEEFMGRRSKGRLRLAHVHSDTIRVLQEMADEDGTGDRFRVWIETQGFIPESLFYTFLGWPERILMRSVDGGVIEGN